MANRTKSNPKSELKAMIDELSADTALAIIPLFQHLVDNGSAEELTDEDELEEAAPARGKKRLAPKTAPAKGKGGRRAAPVEDELDDEDDLGDGLDGDDDDDLDDAPPARGKTKPARGGRRAAPVDDLDDDLDEPAPARGKGRRAAPVEDDLDDDLDDAPPARGKGRRAAPVDDLDDLGDEDDLDAGDDDDLDDAPPARRRAAPAAAKTRRR